MLSTGSCMLHDAFLAYGSHFFVFTAKLFMISDVWNIQFYKSNDIVYIHTIFIKVKNQSNLNSVELQKANLDAQSKGEGGTSSNGSGGLGGNSSSNNSNNSGNLPPLAKLLSNPLFSSLSALGSLGSLSELLSSAANLPGMGGSGGGGGGGGGGHGSGGHHPVQTTGVHRRSHNNSFQPKIKSANSPPPKSKSDRNKFAPY